MTHIYADKETEEAEEIAVVQLAEGLGDEVEDENTNKIPTTRTTVIITVSNPEFVSYTYYSQKSLDGVMGL